MNANRSTSLSPAQRLVSLCAALLCAAALLPSAASADVERGDYRGTTKQPASTGAAPYTGRIEISIGMLSDPPQIFSVELTARLSCADGSTQDVHYDQVIIGPELDGKNRFVYRDGGLELRGRFTGRGKAHGSFSYALGTCSVSGVGWKASAG